MKILAINASPRCGSTHNIINYIEETTTRLYNVDFEIIMLKDKDILGCKGCTICYEKHEDLCPLNDDLKDIVDKMHKADGVIFASPTYVMNISYLMKHMIDRLSYVCHRSCFFEKEAMLITTCAGQIGTRLTLKNLEMPVMSWGFHISSKIGITTGHYTPYILNNKDKGKIEKQVERLIKNINKQLYKKPSITALVGYEYRKIAYTDAIKSEAQSEDLSYWERNGYLKKDSHYFFKLRNQRFKIMLAKIITFFLMRIK